MTWPTGGERTLSWRSYSTYRRWKCICTGDHDVQKDFYTRLGAHDGTPPLPSHLATFSLLWSSLFDIQKISPHHSMNARSDMLGICCKLKLRNTILPTHSSNSVCLCTLDFNPRLAIRLFFFARPINLLLIPLVITFLPPMSFSLLHDIKRTNERANKLTNGNSPLLTSCSSFAYHY